MSSPATTAVFGSMEAASIEYSRCVRPSLHAYQGICELNRLNFEAS
ncbi:hypothetical protein D8I24_0158 (plasmid) [Cupriavidus necator H850]|nr:hypothetical protein D8I24_0158 [Cupriavidus necator H850]